MSAKIGQPRVHSSANQTHGTMKHQTEETWQALSQSMAHAIDPRNPHLTGGLPWPPGYRHQGHCTWPCPETTLQESEGLFQLM